MRLPEGFRARQRAGAPVWLVCAGLLVAGPATATAATQSLHVSAAPNAQATRPEAISATGSVGVPSLVTIFAQFGGAACAGPAGEEATRGAAIVDQRTVGDSFSFSVAFTPTTSGEYLICTYLDGAAGGISEHQTQAFQISVAPASPAPAPPAPTPPAVTPGLVAEPCVVPALERHTEGGAAHLLALAGCKLGRVYRPGARAVRAARRRAGGRARPPLVVSQTPIARTVRTAGYTVAIRLSFGPPPRRSTRKS